jgi:hypothetical protein
MSAEEQFWKWFVEYEMQLFHFETDRERIFDQLAAELRKVDPDLVFEFGPQGTKREFVVSAGGLKRAFPAVASLVAAAPTLARWQVIAFRPRRAPISHVQFGGKRVDPKDVQFALLDDGRMAGIYLFIPGFREDDADLKQIAYLLLDEALGEYDVEAHLGLIKMLSPEQGAGTERYPLAELPARFDKFVGRREGFSGRLS